ncbi:MAG: hypothetical protein RL562_2078 [Planctomycetota bacterium]
MVVGCGRVESGTRGAPRGTAALSNGAPQYSLPEMSGTPAKPLVGRLVSLVAIAAIVSAPGCCGVARYFCGPDDTAWVQERYDTPSHAVATFREAVRRADAETLQRCLGEGFKRRTGLVGVLEAELAWRRITDEVPGLHVLGYATIDVIRRVDETRAVAQLSLDGTRIELGLQRQPYWEVRWTPTDDPEDIERDGRYVGAVGDVVSVEPSPGGLGTTVSIRVPDLDVTIDQPRQVEFAGFGQEWKIESIGEVAADS